MALTYDQITAITNKFYMPKFPELVFDQNFLLKRLWSKGTKPSSGESIKQPVMYQISKGGSYQPYDTFDISAEDQITAADFNWKYYEVPITVSRDEILKNDGPEGIRKLLDAKMMLAREQMSQLITTDFFKLGGTDQGDSAAGVNSLDNLLETAGGALGSTSPYTAGGIDKLTYTWWAGKATDLGGAGFAPTYANLNDAWFDVVDGNIHPTIMVGHNNSINNYMNGLQSQQRFIKQDALTAGFTMTEFNGIPFVADLNVSDAGTTTEASNRIYMLNENFIDVVSHSKENMRLRGFAEPIDQNVSVAHVFWAGNATVSAPKRHCVVHNFDSLISADT